MAALFLYIKNTMNSFLIIFGLALAVVSLCLAGLGIKILLKKRGEFKRHCSSMDPYTGKGGGCVCAKASNNACNNRKQHPYQPLEVNEEMMKELTNKSS